MKTSFRLLLATSALTAAAYAVQTKTWSQNDFPDFEKGELKKLSISSRGRLTLSPVFQEIYDASAPYLWALAVDSKGNVYSGGGGPGGANARVYVVPPGGKGKVLAELEGLEVHALAVDRQDHVFAATAPDGKVYRVDAGKPQLFYDPKAKYIWAMAFDSKGNLYVATGDQGEVHRVAPSGKGDVFFKTGETHARSLAVDAQDNLVVGTEPGGLIIRVSPAGDGFVLYQADKREITAVAVSREGTIYASAVGNKGGAGMSIPLPAAPAPVPAAPPVPGAPAVAPHAVGAAAPVPLAPPPPSIAGGSEVYRIDKDGFPRKVWSHPQHIAYTVAFDPDSRPLIGTGNKGTVYRLDSDVTYTLVTTLATTQITAIQAARDGKLYAATGNVGKVFQIGPGLEKEGTFESDVFDAGMFSYWGRLSFRGSDNGGRLAIETRTGNLDRPQKDWSSWSQAIVSAGGGRIASPPARFVQWRARLEQAPDGRSPQLDQVDVAYMAKNVAPVVEVIEATPANYRFQSAAINIPPSQTINLPPIGKQSPSGPGQMSINPGSSSNSMQAAKGYSGVRWAASDENGDELTYDVYIRGTRESAWKPLKLKLRDKHLSWDGTAFADGSYVVRVVASDAPSNTPEQALAAELVSDPFIIDNTPPVISGLKASANGGKATLRWKAADALSIIEKAEYSINGGDWIPVEPTTRLSDSKELDYELALERAGSETTVAVRVTDEHQNQSVQKTVLE